MTSRIPLVMNGGQIEQLQSGDQISVSASPGGTSGQMQINDGMGGIAGSPFITDVGTGVNAYNLALTTCTGLISQWTNDALFITGGGVNGTTLTFPGVNSGDALSITFNNDGVITGYTSVP